MTRDQQQTLLAVSQSVGVPIELINGYSGLLNTEETPAVSFNSIEDADRVVEGYTMSAGKLFFFRRDVVGRIVFLY